jgi:hypothetical protein
MRTSREPWTRRFRSRTSSQLRARSAYWQERSHLTVTRHASLGTLEVAPSARLGSARLMVPLFAGLLERDEGGTASASARSPGSWA